VPRIRSARRPSDHAKPARVRRYVARELPVRAPGPPATNGFGHGEDAVPQAEAATPREDRAG